MQIIRKYFPDLSQKQVQQFSNLQNLYEHWNAQINVISRKSIDELYLSHVLHSLAIAKIIQFEKGFNVEGDSVNYIHFKSHNYMEPYKITESYFIKTLSAYRKIFRK